MTEPLDIQKLKELCERATPGPWRHAPEQGEGSVVAHETPIGTYVVCDAGTTEEGEFIAAARTALPQALARIEELERERDKMRKWANCGGVPSGKKCRVGEHDIYGPFFGDADGENSICELHGYREWVAALQREVAGLRAALNEHPDKIRIDWLEERGRASTNAMFGQNGGFIVDDEGQVMPGTIDAGYEFTQLREAIDAVRQDPQTQPEVKEP